MKVKGIHVSTCKFVIGPKIFISQLIYPGNLNIEDLYKFIYLDL